MDSINQHLKISKLIAKSIGGDIGPESQKELDSWLNESPENLRLFNRLRDDNNFKNWEEIYHRFSKEQSWQEIEPLLKGKAPSRNIWMISLKFAATLLLPLAIYILFKVGGQTTLPVETTKMVSFDPGQPRAVLLLDNGQTLDLENKDTTVNLDAGATDIHIADNKIEYTHKKKRNQSVQYNTILIPHRGEFFLVLSDGTKVWLNASTTMKYPVSFDGNTREVELSGEAYFEVSPDADRPFIVKTNHVQVEVLGTHFNIKAYPEDKLAQTTLSEGKVKVIANENEVILLPNQQANFVEGSRELNVQNVDAAVFTAWKNGKFMFVDERISYILNDLRKWYDFEVNYESDDLKDIRFSINVNRYEDLNELLKLIEATDKIKFSIEGNKINIHKR
ncbi:FecR family protein [Maribellus luteus]|uniref:FecR family protein n=1 Tax=Maribellus luteus TaxID=2305463 RepID=A0A399T214_9BACT|nr:FecR domain-containing protein [Maribellus luteus]RIJ49878.1 FecR family protein [Maribellus luteus]